VCLPRRCIETTVLRLLHAYPLPWKCLSSRCLATNVYSDFSIPSFGHYVSVLCNPARWQIPTKVQSDLSVVKSVLLQGIGDSKTLTRQILPDVFFHLVNSFEADFTGKRSGQYLKSAKPSEHRASYPIINFTMYRR
jgi:hypothetical protein